VVDLSPAGLLARVLPAPAIGIVADPADWEAALLAGEVEMVARAVDRRRREVAAGRSCARRALARLGAEAGPLPPDPDRVPRWPADVVGSITHTAGFCAAAVAWRRELRALGLDAERPIGSSRGEIMRLVATPTEAAWLARLPEQRQATGSALVFSAKEALYKAQFPLTREFLDFTDVELQLDRVQLDRAGDGHGCGELSAEFRPDKAAARLPPLVARFAVGDDLVVTAAHLLA